MEFGLCGGSDRLELALAAGYDYLEASVAKIMEMSDPDFSEMVGHAAGLGVPVTCCNGLFPGSIRLLDPDTEEAVIADYLTRAFDRLARLGTDTVVFGSGAARMRPENVSYGEAFRRLVRVCWIAADLAEPRGITLVIEPLCRMECNMINSLAEGAALVAAADHPRVKLLADSYHITRDGEPLSDIRRLGGVSHVHVALKGTRLWPITTEPELEECLQLLKETGYTGRISVEGRSDLPEADAGRALRVLKSLWEK